MTTEELDIQFAAPTERIVTLRLTQEQCKEFAEGARIMDVKLTDFIRAAALTACHRIREGDPVMHDLINSMDGTLE